MAGLEVFTHAVLPKTLGEHDILHCWLCQSVVFPSSRDTVDSKRALNGMKRQDEG